MMKFKPPGMGVDLYEVFKTSPGRVDPRTGELVAYKSFKPVAPWESEERMRSRGRRDDDDRPRRFRDDDDRPRRRRDDDDDDFLRSRRDVGGLFRSSSMSGLGDAGGFFGNAIPWVFLGIATIVALEASGVLNLSKKVG